MCDEVQEGSQQLKGSQNQFQSLVDPTIDLLQMTQSTQLAAALNSRSPKNTQRQKQTARSEFALKQISNNLNERNTEDEIQFVNLQKTSALPVKFYSFF